MIRVQVSSTIFAVLRHLSPSPINNWVNFGSTTVIVKWENLKKLEISFIYVRTKTTEKNSE